VGNAERKARKKAGEKFVRVPKEGTPLIDRAWFSALVFSPRTRDWRAPSPKKRLAALRDRGVDIGPLDK
jgi:hypothetical protein